MLEKTSSRKSLSGSASAINARFEPMSYTASMLGDIFRNNSCANPLSKWENEYLREVLVTLYWFHILE